MRRSSGPGGGFRPPRAIDGGGGDDRTTSEVSCKAPLRSILKRPAANLVTSSSATCGAGSNPPKSPAYQPFKPFKIPFGMGTPHPKASVLPVSIDTPQVWPFAQFHFACFSLVPFVQLTCPKVFELTKSRAFNFALRSGSFFRAFFFSSGVCLWKNLAICDFFS